MRRIELRVAGVALLAAIGIVSGPGIGACRSGSRRGRRRHEVPPGDGLARDDGRRDGALAQRLVAQAGRAADAAGRLPGADRRASRRAGPGDPPRRLRRARGRDGRAPRPGEIIGRVALPETFAGLVWSADGKQLYVGGGFDDVIYRFDHAGGLLSNKADLRLPAGRARTPGARRAGASRPTARPSGSPTSTGTPWAGSMPRRARSATRFPSRPIPIPTAWPGMSRASGSTSASGTARRWPWSIPRRARSWPRSRPRSIPTRCSWPGAARSSTSPTRTATR